MNKAIIFTAALLVATPAFAQSSSGTSSQGATKYAPGQQMQNKDKPAPGASEYAPGHQKNTAGPGHSESAPGQRANTGSTTTTGSGSGKKKY
jgi:hypothetical protein